MKILCAHCHRPIPAGARKLRVLRVAFAEMPLARNQSGYCEPHVKPWRQLIDAGYGTMGALAAASDDELVAVDSIGPYWLEQIRSFLEDEWGRYLYLNGVELRGAA
jgi:hypothetical protein